MGIMRVVPRFDLTAPSFHHDPYSVYRKLREAEPVVRTPYGSWVVTRFAEVSALLRDSRLSVRFPDDPDWVTRHGGPGSVTVEDGRRWMLLRDGEDHRGIRGVFHRHFTPAAVERQARRVADAVDAALGALAPGAVVDVVTGLAEPVVAEVLCDLIGFPADRRGRYLEWSSAIARMTGPVPGTGVRERAETAMAEFRTEIGRLAREGRLSGIAAGLLGEETGPREAEFVANTVMLAMAGTDTTVSQIALSVHALLRHPEQLEQARSDPGLVARGTAEFARYDSPVQLVTRRTLLPVRVGDTTVPAGAKVMLSLGAANRDPDRYPAPDRLDLNRPDVARLPFGDGPHYCLGARMSKLVTGTTLAELLRRHPRLTPVAPLDRLEWRPSVVARRPRRLLIRLG
ncbi:cytochrome P450 [Streptomyces roseirectus]|uniref:Cytochrome P450 n=1 Tax=Streptomyces roseirectus TaxID=2768066 RepID=A0A7H0I7U3_9ACTN|nr:cytochrome P450 [Streptomyces roseirectus]QNP68859.1 cytochrome P450 [Streptomyces roseirectus]